MSAQELNLFIIDRNSRLASGLRNYLYKRFGSTLKISTFANGDSALKNIDSNTRIVILDGNIEDNGGTDVTKSIKEINPETEVILLTSNEAVGVAVDTYRNGQSNYVVGKRHSWKRASLLVYKIVTYPVHVLTKEWGLPKYMALFLLSFIGVGLVVYLYFALV